MTGYTTKLNGSEGPLNCSFFHESVSFRVQDIAKTWCKLYLKWPIVTNEFSLECGKVVQRQMYIVAYHLQVAPMVMRWHEDIWRACEWSFYSAKKKETFCPETCKKLFSIDVGQMFFWTIVLWSEFCSRS